MNSTEQSPAPEPVIEDNAVPVPNPETARASGVQIGVTAVAVIAILFVFFYGLNNQRDESVPGASAPVASTQGGGTAGQTSVPTTTVQGQGR